jgi:hypothetical protein
MANPKHSLDEIDQAALDGASLPDPIDVRHGVRLRMPTGDVYSVSWDDLAKRVLLMLDQCGDYKTHSGALAITPRSSNAIEFKPRRRKD